MEAEKIHVTFDHHVLLGLLGLPLLAACIVALLGHQRGAAVRAVSLLASLGTLTLALILAGRFLALEQRGRHDAPFHTATGQPTFQPEFVPGSTAEEPHKTQWELVNFGSGSIQF